MNGWQRFGILLVCCALIMILFPRYDASGWSFIGLTVLMWTGAIMVISLVFNVFALYRFAWLNKLTTLAVMCMIIYTLLWYFPQTDKVSPINKLKYGEYPTKQDINYGLKRLTFNFNFVRRNVHRGENYVNQEVDSKKIKENMKNTISEKADEFIDSFND
ncbi:MAG: hypothetical protein IKO35_01535 [Elusimicrobiaceae bacterium]|nr:hypothetical protein [Elusimicrobiaceae bacterium]